jgi:hypothetical protein
MLPHYRQSELRRVRRETGKGRPQYLRRAETWIRRLDAQVQGKERQLFTHSVQNRRAQELVDVLQSI